MKSYNYLSKKGWYIHTLSKTFREYYGSLTTKKRFSHYEKDGLDFSSLEKLNESIWNKMNGFFEEVDPLKFKGLKENSTETE